MKHLELKINKLEEMVGAEIDPLEIRFGDDGRLLVNDIYGRFNELSEETLCAALNERFVVANPNFMVEAPEIDMELVAKQRGEVLVGRDEDDKSIVEVKELNKLVEAVTNLDIDERRIEAAVRAERVYDSRIFESRDPDRDRFNMPEKSRLDRFDMGKVLKRAMFTISDDIDLSILKNIALGMNGGCILVQTKPEEVKEGEKPTKRSHRKWRRLAFVRSLLALNEFCQGYLSHGVIQAAPKLNNRNDVKVLRQGEIGTGKLRDSLLEGSDKKTTYDIEFPEDIEKKYLHAPVMVIDNLYYLSDSGDFQKVTRKSERYMDSVYLIVKARNERGLLTILETGVGINQFSAWPLCQLLDLIKEGEIQAILNVGEEIGSN